MKLIFLDIDGVLNSTRYVESDYYKQATANMSDAEVMLIAHHLHLDPDALRLVNDLVKRSGAQVILSSTWRGKYSCEEMTEMMKGRGADFVVSDATPALFGKVHSSRIPRGKEIGHYLKLLEKQPDAYVILDDHDDMLTLKDHLVQTDIKLGLTQDDVEKALKILNGETNDSQVS
jgi:Swiss Army Knife RNA repair-like protein